MMKVCAECGSSAIVQDAWIDPNTNKIVDTFDDYYCENCDGACLVEEMEEPDES
jgi:hypothetical protein